ncbi:MAG: electron transfer flavoprotein subunit beta/FixA family protein [Deltaproteobacteria bacterium]|nr:electron transfer flavoprotein subunit beta/FixA family protein [Deltaproteobacteria bacterium]
MKIGVLLKQVPDTATKVKIVNDAIDESEVKWVINPYDEYAVEAALRLKEKAGGGEVVIVTAGPARAVETMRQVLAMGADRGIRIDTAGLTLDPYTTAVMLAAACKDEQFNIIFAGKQAVDDDCAQVHIGVAEFLQIPHVSPIEKFELNADLTQAVVERPVSGGVKEVIEVKLPAVFGCEKGLNEPRYASLPGIMKAKSKPMKELSGRDLLQGKTPLLAQSQYALPPEGRKGKMISGTAHEAAKELVRLLREEAKVV